MSQDMDPEAFRREAHRIADWIADYFAAPDRYPVLSRVRPGEIRAALPASAPEHGESFDAIFSDFERLILPGITHWNHPGFFAYFAISGSAPGVLAEFLSAALNVQAMLWRTSPAATELEEVSLAWLRQLIGLPDSFEGVIYDTASITTLHALAAAGRQRCPTCARAGCGADRLAGMRVYCSEHAHSSVDKAVILLGLGTSRLRRIEADAEFRMRPDALAAAMPRTGAQASGRSPWSRPWARRRPPASILSEQSRRSARASGSGSCRCRVRGSRGDASGISFAAADAATAGLRCAQSAQVAVRPVRLERALLPAGWTRSGPRSR
jgi:aromatic-L-amino-acid decarboxylase